MALFHPHRPQPAVAALQKAMSDAALAVAWTQLRPSHGDDLSRPTDLSDSVGSVIVPPWQPVPRQQDH